jgi:hypothetical protein
MLMKDGSGAKFCPPASPFAREEEFALNLPTKRQTDGWTDKQLYLSTGRQIYVRTDGWTDGKTDKQVDKGTDRQMGGLKESHKNGQIDKQRDR